MEQEIYLIVKSIDLITEDEAKKLPYDLRHVGRFWWLNAVDQHQDRCKCVDIEGNFCDLPFEGKNLAVRPALYIEGLDTLRLPLYTELKIFDFDWIYIGNDKALAKYYLFSSLFFSSVLEETEYSNSLIKRTIDKWLKYKKAKFNEE